MNRRAIFAPSLRDYISRAWHAARGGEPKPTIGKRRRGVRPPRFCEHCIEEDDISLKQQRSGNRWISALIGDVLQM
jgi:hypothetical protein